MDMEFERNEIDLRHMINSQIILKQQVDIDVAYERLSIERYEANLMLLSHKIEVTENQEDYQSFSQESDWEIQNINQANVNIETILNQYNYDRDMLKFDILELSHEL